MSLEADKVSDLLQVYLRNSLFALNHSFLTLRNCKNICSIVMPLKQWRTFQAVSLAIH